MFEIAAGILIAVFVLVFFRIFLALGILLLGLALVGIAIYIFDLDWVIHFLKILLTNPVLLGMGALAIIGHFLMKKTDKLEANIQSHHGLLYGLQELNSRKNDVNYKIEPRKYFAYRYFYETNIGSFWIVYEQWQYSFYKKKLVFIYQGLIKKLQLNQNTIKTLFTIVEVF